MNVQVYLRLDRLLMNQPDLAMPVLQHLLAKGSVTKNTQTYEAALCQAFGIKQQPDWPAAALSWLGEGNEPGEGFWLYADPVNLQLQRDHFTLGLPAPLTLSKAEADTLRASLNQHFREDGLEFKIGNSGRWYLQQTVSSNMVASFPSQAAGRDIRNHLPMGQDAERWRGVLNEIQMLLHEHPINNAREEQGQPVINSFWISGPGKLPSQGKGPSKTVFAAEPLARGLAEWAGKAALPLPDGFDYPKEKDVLLVPKDGQENLEQVLAKILAALSKRSIRHLVLNIFFHDRQLHVALKPSDLWKFWRKPLPLASYFSW